MKLVRLKSDKDKDKDGPPGPPPPKQNVPEEEMIDIPTTKIPVAKPVSVEEDKGEIEIPTAKPKVMGGGEKPKIVLSKAVPAKSLKQAKPIPPPLGLNQDKPKPTLGNPVAKTLSKESSPRKSLLSKPEQTFQKTENHMDRDKVLKKTSPGPEEVPEISEAPKLGPGFQECKELLEEYCNVCDNLAEDTAPTDLIDVLEAFVKSLGLDAVSLVLMKSGKLEKVISRGYKTPPPAEISGMFQECIADDSIDWDKMLETVEMPEGILAKWLESEDLARIGYIPVTDGKKISGILISASYGEQEISPLASILLEICGGRIALAGI